MVQPSCPGLVLRPVVAWGPSNLFLLSPGAVAVSCVLGCMRHKGQQVLLVTLDFVDFGGPKLLFRDFPARSSLRHGVGQLRGADNR